MSKAFEDKELIELFQDSVSRSIEAIKPSPFIILHVNGNEFLDGLKKAATAANGLAHTQANPTWLAIRDSLDNMANMFKTLIIACKQPPRAKITAVLQKVLSSSLIMASSKSMGRQEVLIGLDHRKTSHKVN